MKKKIFLFLLFFCFTICLFGCEKKDDKPDNTIKKPVNAFNIKDVYNAYSTTGLVMNVNSFVSDENKINVKLDESAKKIIITSGKISVSFDYNDEYISYTDNDTKVTYDSAVDNMYVTMYGTNFLEVLMTLSGNEKNNIDEEKIKYDNMTYANDGFEMKGETYSFNKTEDGEDTTLKGLFVRSLKVSLDKDVINNFANKYGSVSN